MAAKHGPSAYASHRRRCPLVPQLANGLLVPATGILPVCKSSFPAQRSASCLFSPSTPVYVHVVPYSTVDSIATHYVKRHCNRQHVSNGIFFFFFFFFCFFLLT
ncbi:hypothetical protein TRIATDRAFT_259281 [Trichoderma atroviride IMI 206040]|uniref:Uncharacterized protein n=1 Tax=Hypocrea atroviridis (strain ATCC 20476 / IMI 206040) TaxID=452589 RepID=G9P5S7_HYPAI|nr:uncharacterized protein TRIATDRAFT_301950 [Trichoderma atroviride IMI 206040]EHK41369.1 hypothetical protein TRIATDRAFT_259281 [Trichoderma atroviride IMI 206040]